MSLYTLLLLVHISGAVCLFSGIGIWLFGIAAIARATRVEQIRTLADLLLMVRLVVSASALPNGALPPILSGRTRDRVLRMAIHMLVAMLFGIVFLMTTKSSLVGGLAVMVISAFVGLVSSAPFLLASQAPTTNAMGKDHE